MKDTLFSATVMAQLKKLWLPVHVLIPKTLGLEDVSMALCEQVITIDKSQICLYVGVLGQVSFAKVMVATLISLGFMPVERRRQITRESLLPIWAARSPYHTMFTHFSKPLADFRGP